MNTKRGYSFGTVKISLRALTVSSSIFFHRPAAIPAFRCSSSLSKGYANI